MPQSGFIGLSSLDKELKNQPTTGTEPQATGGAGTPPQPLELQAEQQQDQGMFKRFSDSLPFVPAKVGPAEGVGQLRGDFDSRLRLPLLQIGVRPEDAEIKLGRLYFDFRSLTIGYLASDNIDQSQLTRNWGHVMVVRAEMALLYQLTDQLQLAVAGEIGWLPFSNQVGFTDPLLDLELSLAPLAQIQLNYAIPTPTWQFNFFDQFQVRRNTLGVGRNFDLLNRNPQDLTDRAGRYVFNVRQQTPSQNRQLDSTVEYHNVIGAQVDRLFPTQTRFTATLQHENIWYQQNTNALPTTIDQANFVLQSERENLRFKPFAQFTTTKQTGNPGWDMTARGGLRGPITDYIDFFGDGGYFWSGDGTRQSSVFTLGLLHEPKHNLRHSLVFTRNITYPERVLTDLIEYRVEYTFHPDMLGEIAVNRATFDSLSFNNTRGEQQQAEARVTWLAGPRLTLRPGVAYTEGRTFGAATSDFSVFDARFEVFYQFGPRFRAEFMYQYEQRDSSTALDSYYENLFTLSIIKYF